MIDSSNAFLIEDHDDVCDSELAPPRLAAGVCSSYVDGDWLLGY